MARNQGGVESLLWLGVMAEFWAVLPDGFEAGAVGGVEARELAGMHSAVAMCNKGVSIAVVL